MFPIAMAAASQPQSFVLAILVGASVSFITPIGYQTNMIVERLGRYDWGDFLRVGLLPAVAAVVVAIVVIVWAFPPLI